MGMILVPDIETFSVNLKKFKELKVHAIGKSVPINLLMPHLRLT